MRTLQLRAITTAFSGLIAVSASAAVVEVSFSSKMYRSDLIPPFGEYTVDVLIEKWTTVSGTLLIERNSTSEPGVVLGAPKLHLENFLYYNGDNVSAQVQLFEGWSVTPTDWTVGWDQSYAVLDAAGVPSFQLLATRGRDINSTNRPFHFGGNLGPYPDLLWVQVRQDEATWHIQPGIDRRAPVVFSVRAVPEPSAVAQMLAGLLLVWAARRWSLKRA
jgi:hypothetical protein